MFGQAIDFLSGKIGKFGDSAAQFAKNISVEGMQKGWDTYMKQSPEELANVARANMQRKNTILSNLNMNKIEEAYAVADKTNADYVTEYSKLKGALNAGNISEAKSVANNISKRFQDNKYLEYLNEAESKTTNFKQQIKKVPVNDIKNKSINDIEQKIAQNKIAQKFTTKEQQEWLANKAYSARGALPHHYFNSGNSKTNQVRAAVSGGIYMGGSMVVRGLQGGNPVTNEYGERDIAGIPFI